VGNRQVMFSLVQCSNSHSASPIKTELPLACASKFVPKMVRILCPLSKKISENDQINHCSCKIVRNEIIEEVRYKTVII